jgi:hypothetical protein
MSRQHFAETAMRANKPTARPGTPASAGHSSRQTNLRRRGFLLTLGIGGAGAAAVALQSRTGGAIAPQGAIDADADGKGYQMTEHIRRYYQTAKT